MTKSTHRKKNSPKNFSYSPVQCRIIVQNGAGALHIQLSHYQLIFDEFIQDSQPNFLAFESTFIVKLKLKVSTQFSIHFSPKIEEIFHDTELCLTF